MTKRLTILIALTATLLVAGAAQAQQAAASQVMVAPTRLILGARTRSAELSLVNPGAKSGTYRISLARVRMQEDGSMKEAGTPTADELATEQLLRFSPRQVTLDPQVAQTVRVQMRPQADLPAGEYRVNLVVRAVPDAAPVDAKKGEGLSVDVSILYGVSIPIIIRQGETSASASLTDIAIERGEKPAILLHINRSGNRSVFGHLTAKFIPAGGGKPMVVGILRGVAVYADLPMRRVALALQPGAKLEHGRLDVTYVDGEGGNATLAAGSLDVP